MTNTTANAGGSSIAQQTLVLLAELEQVMQANQLWDAAAPEPQRLLSSQPFATDTLDFYQWVQFIMIPSLQQCVAEQKPLPNKIAVSPMAIEVWRGQLKTYRDVILALKAIDELLDGHHDRH